MIVKSLFVTTTETASLLRDKPLPLVGQMKLWVWVSEVATRANFIHSNLKLETPKPKYLGVWVHYQQGSEIAETLVFPSWPYIINRHYRCCPLCQHLARHRRVTSHHNNAAGELPEQRSCVWCNRYNYDCHIRSALLVCETSILNERWRYIQDPILPLSDMLCSLSFFALCI